MKNQCSETSLVLKYLIEDLESSNDAISALSPYIPSLQSEPMLLELFKTLGYDEKAKTFTRPISAAEILSKLKSCNSPIISEDEFIIENWDIEHNFKDEYSKTFLENKLQILSDSIDLALPDTDVDYSLVSLWSSPVKKSDTSTTETPKNSKGLKQLTLKVRSITHSKGFFSYKEVADELIKELEITEGLDRAKEEKNILRRVYDALNVLIASEIVVKIGKKYVWKHTVIDQNAITRSQIKEKKKKLNSKREELKKIASKYFSLKSLINRNRTLNSEDIIRFPFVIVGTEENSENSIKLESNINITEIGLKFLREIKLFSDYEILQKLKLKQDLSVVPEEVTNLLSIH